jgi:hypothetical protein
VLGVLAPKNQTGLFDEDEETNNDQTDAGTGRRSAAGSGRPA